MTRQGTVAGLRYSPCNFLPWTYDRGMPRDAILMIRDDHFSPMPTNVSKRGISGFAERLASELAYSLGAPLEPIVARIGGKISYLKAPKVEI